VLALALQLREYPVGVREPKRTKMRLN